MHAFHVNIKVNGELWVSLLKTKNREKKCALVRKVSVQNLLLKRFNDAFIGEKFQDISILKL